MTFDFRFVPPSPESISGHAVLDQTELAINELGAMVEAGAGSSREARELAEKALIVATSAESTAASASGTAQNALDQVAPLIDALDRVQSVAGEAKTHADQALDTATQAKDTADTAQATATQAKDTADTAQTTATQAKDTADTAKNLSVSAHEAAYEAAQTAFNAMGVFAVDTSGEFNPDTTFSAPVKTFVEAIVSEATLPVTLPAYFWSVKTSDDTKVVQYTHAASSPDIMYSRTGVVTFPEPPLSPESPLSPEPPLSLEPTVTWSEWTSSRGDVLTPADIGAAASTISITAGTGLTGGGNLESNRTLAVKYGSTAGTACEGNDPRLGNARTPLAHAASHRLGGADPLKASDFGGLEASSVAGLEAYRQSRIGTPHHLSSTTLPAGYMWADGSLALFSDWPELAAAYSAGRFNDMLLAYTASSYDKQNYPAKFVPNAANPSGLYLPRLGGLFSRYWTPGSGNVGSYEEDAVQTGITMIETLPTMDHGFGVVTVAGNLARGLRAPNAYSSATSQNTKQNVTYTINQRLADRTRPENVAVPVAVYLGVHA